MKNLKMMNEKRIHDIEAHEMDVVLAAKKEKAMAYINLLNESLGDGRAFLRGFVHSSACVQEVTLRLSRTELLSDYSIYTEMVDIETNKAYAFMDINELLRNFVVVENVDNGGVSCENNAG